MSAAILEDSDGQRPEWLIPSGVFIVTLQSGNRVNAYAAGWVVRVSEEPVMIQVAVWDQNYSYELAQDCDHFVVQILAEGQQDTALYFGKHSGRNTVKLQEYATHPGLSGIPVLDDCLAFLECEVIFRRQFGDHMILVGKAIQSKINNTVNHALVCKQREYTEPRGSADIHQSRPPRDLGSDGPYRRSAAWPQGRRSPHRYSGSRPDRFKLMLGTEVVGCAG